MNTETNVNHLNDAAVIMQESFKDPVALLGFLNEAVGWLVNWEFKGPEKYKGTECHFFARLMIIEIVIPWLKSDGKAVDIIAHGLNAVLEFYGPDGFSEGAGLVMAALGYNIAETGVYTESHLLSYQKGINSLLSISDNLYDYARQKDRLHAA